MSEQYKPGTVALVRYRSEERRAFLTDYHKALTWHFEQPVGERTGAGPADVSVIRTLVALDREDREQLSLLADSLGTYLYSGTLGQLADSLRLLEELPKPEEKGPLVEFHADGKQYFVVSFARDKFLAAESDTRRTALAELVIERSTGKVLKNRCGGNV